MWRELFSEIKAFFWAQRVLTQHAVEPSLRAALFPTPSTPAASHTSGTL